MKKLIIILGVALLVVLLTSVKIDTEWCNSGGTELACEGKFKFDLFYRLDDLLNK